MTATDPLALEGRGERPLTAVTPIDMEPSQFLLDEVAGHIAEADIGVIVAGRQLDPELREPLAHLARVAGFPILAEPTSQLRCGPHDRSHVVTAYDLLLRDERFRESRLAGPGAALRRDADQQAAALLAGRIRRRPDRRRPARRLERADPPGGGAAARRPDRAGGRLGGAARRGAPAAGDVAARPSGRPARRSRRSWRRATRSPSPACSSPSARAYGDGDLVYTASSMPIRDQEAFLPATEADAPSSATAAPTGSTA